jgi:hypothetical protein
MVSELQGDMSYSYWASTDKPANNPDIAPKVLVVATAAYSSNKQFQALCLY